MVIEEGRENLRIETDEEGDTSSEEVLERAGRHLRVPVRKRRQGKKVDNSET
jgi:hypothetical protein